MMKLTQALLSTSFLATIFFTFCLKTESNAANKIFDVHQINTKDTLINPLSTYSKEWVLLKYQDCNTAKDIKFLSPTEKEVVYILNMIRMNPVLFLNSVVLSPTSPFCKSPSKRNAYDQSLIKTLKTLKPNFSFIIPNEQAYISANCHAVYSGKTGYVGHDRRNSNCREDFYAECCSYGDADALSILLSLLFDYNVPSLGHRNICLSPSYSSMGVSIQPHKIYEYNAVLDFK